MQCYSAVVHGTEGIMSAFIVSLFPCLDGFVSQAARGSATDVEGRTGGSTIFQRFRVLGCCCCNSAASNCVEATL